MYAQPIVFTYFYTWSLIWIWQITSHHLPIWYDGRKVGKYQAKFASSSPGRPTQWLTFFIIAIHFAQLLFTLRPIYPFPTLMKTELPPMWLGYICSCPSRPHNWGHNFLLYSLKFIWTSRSHNQLQRLLQWWSINEWPLRSRQDEATLTIFKWTTSTCERSKMTEWLYRLGVPWNCWHRFLCSASNGLQHLFIPM